MANIIGSVGKYLKDYAPANPTAVVNAVNPYGNTAWNTNSETYVKADNPARYNRITPKADGGIDPDAGGGKGISDASASAVSAPAYGGASGGDSFYDVYSAALEAQRQARQAAYDAAAQAQEAQYRNSVNQLGAARDRALQEAYINRMQGQRTMNQGLTAQGLTGGASETSLASLLNNYERSRNGTEKAYLGEKANLDATHAANMASLRNILSSGVAGDTAQYISNLANLAAQNGINPLTLYQQQGGDTHNAQSWYEYLQNFLQSRGLNANA